MKAVLYSRVSTDAQEQDGTSLDTQEQRCLAIATERGWTVVETIRDTASGYTLDRPGMATVRRLIRERQIDVVVTFAIDRLARHQMKLAVLVDEMQSRGVLLECVTEKFDDSAIGRFILSARGFAAELEREKIAERTNRGRYAKARNGEVVGTGLAPYGYRYLQHTDERSGKNVVVGYALDPGASPIMRRVFEMLAKDSALTVASQLNAEGLRGPRDGPWVAETILDMARNPVYVGQPAYGRRQRVDGKLVGRRPEDEWVTTSAPAIVDRDLWDSVQDALRDRRKHLRTARLDPDPFLLRGLVRCGHCSGALACETRHGIRLYGCQRRIPRQAMRQNRPVCDAKPAHAHDLEQAVWHTCEGFISDPTKLIGELQHQRADARNTTVSPQRQAEIERELWRFRNRLRNANDELLDATPGTANYTDLKAKSADAQRHIARLESEQRSVVEMVPADDALESVDTFIRAFQKEVDSLTDTARRESFLRVFRVTVTLTMAKGRGTSKLGRHTYDVAIESGLLMNRGSGEQDF